MKNTRGNSLVELVMVINFMAALIFMIIDGFGLFLVKYHVHSVARHGAQLISENLVSDTVVHQELRNYLKDFKSPYLKNAQIELGRFRDTPSSRFYDLVFTKIIVEPDKLQIPSISERVVIQRAYRGNR